MIYETRVEKAIEITENGQPYINPYDGCVPAVVLLLAGTGGLGRQYRH